MHSEPFFTPFAKSIYDTRYKHPDDGNWSGTAKRVVGSVTGELFNAPNAQSHISEILELQDRLYSLVDSRAFMPGGRYLYAAGRDLHQVNNCVLLRAEDSREGWAGLAYKSAMALMTGAGIGVWYGDIRASGSDITRTGGTASGPLPLAELVNNQGRCYLQGGNRRSAIWAGFPWWHPDIFRFLGSKNWPDELRDLKAKILEKDKELKLTRADQDAMLGRGEPLPLTELALPMETTNISVTLDDDFFHAYKQSTGFASVSFFSEHGFTAPDGGTWEEWAHQVYDVALKLMLKNGEPGFTIDVGNHSGEVLRNACTEITSTDDSDVCNLGSLVLPRFDSVSDFRKGAIDAVQFLTAGSMYSHVPYDKIEEVRDKNRRLGLGLIGVHEFCMKHGVKYGTDDAFEVLEPYALEYARALEYANEQQSALGITLSIGASAIAPNGTIGAVAESTPSADPIFAAAEIRRVVDASPTGDQYTDHVVVDPTAARLVAEGIPSNLIEDAYTLSIEPERRIAQQAFLQDYTDHAISSTINLPAPITNPQEASEFGETLMRYLPRLRGITCYPDGAIAGQPRTSCDLDWALENEGLVLEAREDTCNGSVCGV